MTTTGMVLPAIRPAPTGSARAGSLTPFTNLATDLDANFAAIRSWATSAQSNFSYVETGYSGWLSLGSGWALYSSGTYSWIRRCGRIAIINHVSSYTGTITGTSTGDITTDLTMATITDTKLRPHQQTVLTGQFYTGGLIAANIVIQTSGAIVLTGTSTAITMTNPGVAFYGCYLLPSTIIT